MEEILIAVALIIVVALLFWLDKKAERGTPEAGSMYKEILQTFERVWWCMSSGELKEIFPNKQFSDREESDGLAGIGYTDQIEGHETFVNFYFLKVDKEGLVGIYFRILHIPADRSNFLFSKLCEKYGFPLNHDSAEGKFVLWDLENSVLTFEVSDDQELQIRFWDKAFYNKK